MQSAPNLRLARALDVKQQPEIDASLSFCSLDSMFPSSPGMEPIWENKTITQKQNAHNGNHNVPHARVQAFETGCFDSTVRKLGLRIDLDVR